MPEDSKNINQNSLLSKWLNREKKPQPSKGLHPRPEAIRVPLSLGQQRLLFLQQLYPENPFYHYADAFRFKGKLNVEILIKSFEITAQRHDILRTKVVFENGQAYQQINEKPIFEISEHDLTGLPAAEVEDVCRGLAIKEARKSLESPNGYITRISVLRLNEDETLIVLTMHHIIMDKWSMNLLQNEVAGYYRKLVNSEAINFPPLQLQYADFAYHQSISKPNPENLTYWKNKLQNSLTLLELPTDFPRPYRPTFSGAYSTQQFSIGLANKLRNFCRQQNKTLYTVILTAFKNLLKRYTGENDILVGSPFTNRDDIALETLIGFFDDTLVLRSDLSNDPTFVELLEKVWATTQAAFAHKNMPFEVLVKSLKPERYLNHNPLFQVMFIYHDVPGVPDFGEDLKMTHMPFDFGVTKFDLTLFIAEKAGEITAIFEYSKDLFVQETIERMHGHLGKLLGQICENPHRPISELDIITDQELASFSEWNDTNTHTTKARSVIELLTSKSFQALINLHYRFRNRQSLIQN